MAMKGVGSEDLRDSDPKIVVSRVSWCNVRTMVIKARILIVMEANWYSGTVTGRSWTRNEKWKLAKGEASER